jgi:hypothetical protein
MHAIGLRLSTFCNCDASYFHGVIVTAVIAATAGKSCRRLTKTARGRLLDLAKCHDDSFGDEFELKGP